MQNGIIGKKILVIGGGTGVSTVIHGLKAYPVYPMSIHTVADNGGNTGVLRDKYGVLPWGDARRALLAHLDDGGDDTLRRILTYRFPHEIGGAGLSGLVGGNAFLTIAEILWGRAEGLERVSKLFRVRGEFHPVSIEDTHLIAELSDGSEVFGETNIDLRSSDDTRLIKRIKLSPEPIVYAKAAEAIQKADVIVFGPGDLFTSIIPNLLVRGVSEALRSSNAKMVFVVNMMTKPAETRGYTAANFVEQLLSYDIGKDMLDAVLVNNAPIPEELIVHYKTKAGAEPVLINEEVERSLSSLAHTLTRGNYVDISADALKEKIIRHEPSYLAKDIVRVT